VVRQLSVDCPTEKRRCTLIIGLKTGDGPHTRNSRLEALHGRTAGVRRVVAGKRDGTYRVHLIAGFKKYRADSRGEQKEVPASDWIDIGVLGAQGKYLYLHKHKIEKDKTELDLVVNQLPAQAGIDPMNKLIDRNPADNLVKVTEAK
jgi:hypothetical protein